MLVMVCMPLIPAHGWQKQAWSKSEFQGQPGLHTNPISKRRREERKGKEKQKILKKICIQLSIIKFGASGMGLDRVFS